MAAVAVAAVVEVVEVAVVEVAAAVAAQQARVDVQPWRRRGLCPACSDQAPD